jgi:hypothetical protein
MLASSGRLSEGPDMGGQYTLKRFMSRVLEFHKGGEAPA